MIGRDGGKGVLEARRSPGDGMRGAGGVWRWLRRRGRRNPWLIDSFIFHVNLTGLELATELFAATGVEPTELLGRLGRGGGEPS